jgi:hypothetical protein
MSQQHCESIPPYISSRAQFLESSDVTVSVLISGTGISPKDCIGLRGHIPGELLNKLLKGHRQIPFLMFSMACSPN